MDPIIDFKDLISSDVEYFRTKAIIICDELHDVLPDYHIKTYRILGTRTDQERLCALTIKAPNELCALLLYAEYEFQKHKKMDHYKYYFELLSKDHETDIYDLDKHFISRSYKPFYPLFFVFFYGSPDENPFEESFNRCEDIEITNKSVKPFEL